MLAIAELWLIHFLGQLSTDTYLSYSQLKST
jgi:hypothetical protein